MSANLHAPKDPSANEMLKVSEQISGEDKGNGAPDLPVLQLIVMIRKAEAVKDDVWSNFVNEELKYLKAAVHLLMNDSMINFKFGTTMKGAMELVGILRARAAEKDIESRLDPVVDKQLIPHMAGNKNFVDAGGFKDQIEENNKLFA